MEITGTPGLPVGYSYWYEAENDKEFTIKIKEIWEENIALEWVKQLSMCSFTIWKVDKTYRQGYDVLFKKHFRCHHAVTFSSKSLKCNALMNIRIMRNRIAGQWPCIAHFKGRHKHEVGVPFSIVYHPITEDIKNEILELYRKGYHQHNAYTAFCKKNISDLGLDSWAFFADKYIFPTKEDFKQVWMRFVRDAYITRMSSKKHKEEVGSTASDASSYEESHMDVQDLDEEYFGKKMIDETNNRLDAHMEKPLNTFELNSSKNSNICESEESPVKTKHIISNEVNKTDKDTTSLFVENKNNTNVKMNIENESFIQSVLRRIRPQLEEMNKENLITLCIGKIVEEILAKSAFKKLYGIMEDHGIDVRDEMSASNNEFWMTNDINVIICSLCNEKNSAI